MSRASGFLGIQVKPLYSQSEPEITGRLLKQTEASRDGEIIQIQIFQNGLKQTKTQRNIKITKWMQFQFDLIFNPIASSQKIQFDKEYFESRLQLKSSQELQAWTNILKDKLNQKGFHNSFEILNKLGKGSYGTVFAAKKKQNGVTYAMKSLNKESAYNEQNGKNCIMKQIQILRKLKHNNLICLHEVFQTQTSLFMEFDLLDGGNLQQYFTEDYKFQPYQIRQIMKGILQGLKEMHKLKIMHRDLKPENILFRKKNSFEPVIADFGLAQFVNVSKYLFVRCGSAGFVAPEVINSKNQKNRYDLSCDLFSLGILFHILLYGKSIFPSKQYDEIVAENKACKFNFEDSMYKNTNPCILSLLKQLLQKDPRQRISAQQALKHQYFKAQEIDTWFTKQKSDSGSEKQEAETKDDRQQSEENQNEELKQPEILKPQHRSSACNQGSSYHAKFQRLQKSYFRSKQPNYLVNKF